VAGGPTSRLTAVNEIVATNLKLSEGVGQPYENPLAANSLNMFSKASTAVSGKPLSFMATETVSRNDDDNSTISTLNFGLQREKI
jgi:hypothetical protein